METSCWTANQAVAWNLIYARHEAGLTQEEAGARLEPYLGQAWSQAVFSLAERSVDGRRVRQFDADEIMAFARAFNRPVSWFFTPPTAPDPLSKLPEITPPTDVETERLVDARTMLDAWIGNGAILEGRIEPVLRELPSGDRDQLTFALEDEHKAYRAWQRGHKIDRAHAERGYYAGPIKKEEDEDDG